MPHTEITSLRANQPKDAHSPLFVFVTFISPRALPLRGVQKMDAAECSRERRCFSLPLSPSHAKEKQSVRVCNFKSNVIGPRM